MAYASDLVHQASQFRIGLLVDEAGETYPDLRGIVASKDRPVLYQCHLATESGGGYGRADAGYPSTHDHEVIFPGLFRASQAKGLLPECGICFRSRSVDILCQVNGVAAAFEAGQVMEGYPVLASLQLDGASILPGPLFGLRPEYGSGLLPVHKHLETSRTLGPSPGSCPIARTYPQAVCALLGDAETCGSIFYRPSHPVSYQIGRPHLHHRLVVVRPTTRIVETFRLKEYGLG